MVNNPKTDAWFNLRDRLQAGHITYFGADWGKPGDDQTIYREIDLLRERAEARPAPPGRGPQLDFHRNADGVYEFT